MSDRLRCWVLAKIDVGDLSEPLDGFEDIDQVAGYVQGVLNKELVKEGDKVVDLSIYRSLEDLVLDINDGVWNEAVKDDDAGI
jgi:hypothetical protein